MRALIGLDLVRKLPTRDCEIRDTKARPLHGATVACVVRPAPPLCRLGKSALFRPPAFPVHQHTEASIAKADPRLRQLPHSLPRRAGNGSFRLR